MELLALILTGLSFIALGNVFSSSVLTDRARIYDLVKDEYDTRVTRVSGTLKNTHANTIAAGAVTVGFPVKLVGAQWVTVLAGDEANIKGLWLGDPATQPFLESLAQNAISALPGQILAKGPAVIDKNRIPTVDLSTSPGTFTLSTIVTSLAALGITTLAEPSTNAQQTS